MERCASLSLYAPLDANNDLESYFSDKVPGNPDKLTSKTEFLLGGEKGIMVEYAPYTKSETNQYFGVGVEINAIHNKKVFRLWLGETGPDQKAIKTTADWKYKATFNQILSTFKFTQ